MKRINFLYFLVAALILSSCVSKKQKEKTLNFSGAFALYPLAIKWSEEYKKEHEDRGYEKSSKLCLPAWL